MECTKYDCPSNDGGECFERDCVYKDDENFSDGSRSIEEFMGDDESVWGYDGEN